MVEARHEGQGFRPLFALHHPVALNVAHVLVHRRKVSVSRVQLLAEQPNGKAEAEVLWLDSVLA